MNIVRELRIQKGIQQKELALELGISNAAVSNWEKGKSDPSGKRLKQLAEYFNVDNLVILGKKPIEEIPLFKTADPNVVGVSETEQIVQYVMNKLENKQNSAEISILTNMMQKMSKDERERVIAVVRAMFANRPDIIE